MKRLILLVVTFSLFAEDKDPSYWSFHPLHAGFNAIALSNANVNYTDGPHSGNLDFNKESVYVYQIVPINRQNFFFPRVEWNRFTLDWNKNPRFRAHNFQYIQFALTFMSIALENWRWIARADVNLDVKNFSDFNGYGLFSALLWGTHTVNERWKYHIGALGYTGLKGQMVYPIAGFDYKLSDRWNFQAVFPINYSIEYSPNTEWRYSIKGRPLKERFRSGDSVFCYSTMGLEFNIHYEKFLRCEAEIFGGYSFGGSFYIKNKEAQDAIYTSVESSPYGGASFNWGF